jgi:hypothetical protein
VAHEHRLGGAEALHALRRTRTGGAARRGGRRPAAGTWRRMTGDALGGRGRPAALLEDEAVRLEDEDDRWHATGGRGGRPTVLRVEEVDNWRH